MGGMKEVNGVILYKHKGLAVTTADRAILFIFAKLIEGELASVLERKEDITKKVGFELNPEVHKIGLGQMLWHEAFWRFCVNKIVRMEKSTKDWEEVDQSIPLGLVGCELLSDSVSPRYRTFIPTDTGIPGSLNRKPWSQVESSDPMKSLFAKNRQWIRFGPQLAPDKAHISQPHEGLSSSSILPTQCHCLLWQQGTLPACAASWPSFIPLSISAPSARPRCTSLFWMSHPQTKLASCCSNWPDGKLPYFVHSCYLLKCILFNLSYQVS